MALAYVSPISPGKKPFRLPQPVRDGIVLHAVLSSDERKDDDYALTPERLHTALHILRRRNGGYRFYVMAGQPDLDICRYESMSGEQVTAELKWRGIDPRPTIASVTSLVRQKLEEFRQRGLLPETPQEPVRTPPPTLTIDEVYQRHGDFRYRIFPHDILGPIVGTLTQQLAPAERLEDRVQYVPPTDPFDMQLGAYLDVTASEMPRRVADTVRAVARDCASIPFARVEIAYKPSTT
jgi:hypothetical protein